MSQHSHVWQKIHEFKSQLKQRSPDVPLPGHLPRVLHGDTRHSWSCLAIQPLQCLLDLPKPTGQHNSPSPVCAFTNHYSAPQYKVGPHLLLLRSIIRNKSLKLKRNTSNQKFPPGCSCRTHKAVLASVALSLMEFSMFLQLEEGPSAGGGSRPSQPVFASLNTRVANLVFFFSFSCFVFLSFCLNTAVRCPAGLFPIIPVQNWFHPLHGGCSHLHGPITSSCNVNSHGTHYSFVTTSVQNCRTKCAIHTAQRVIKRQGNGF